MYDIAEQFINSLRELNVILEKNLIMANELKDGTAIIESIKKNANDFNEIVDNIWVSDVELNTFILKKLSKLLEDITKKLHKLHELLPLASKRYFAQVEEPDI